MHVLPLKNIASKSTAMLIALALFLSVTYAFITPAFAADKEDFEVKEKVFVHYPRPGKGGKPPQGAVCTPEGDDTVKDSKLAGWHMPSTGMSYKINVSSMPFNLSSSGVDAIKRAFDEWHTNDTSKIFTYEGETTVSQARRDGTNAIAWKRINSSAIGITYTWYRTDTNEVVETDTLFNTNVPWTVLPEDSSQNKGCYADVLAYDVQNIATHEFGHWVGLDDLYNTQDEALTMFGYGSFGEVKKDTLGLGDEAGLSAVEP